MLQRRSLDAVLLVLGALVLSGSAVLARQGLYSWEASLFGAFNGLPDAL